MGVRALTDHREALALPEVGAVIVATPNGLHTQIVLDASAAKKHVFCEKPMAFTVAECDQMIAACGRHGVRLMVGQVLRLLPLFQRVIDVFDSGQLGRPVTAQITRIGWLGDPKARYRLTKALTGGQLYDISVHEIDLLHRLFGPTESVFACSDNFVQRHVDYDDTDHLLLRFRNGGVAALFASLASTLGTSHGTIVGEQGTLRYDHSAGTITYRRAGDRSGPGEQPVTETVKRSDGENGYLRELRSFTEWVLHGEEPLLTAAEGRAAVQVVEAAYKSAATGELVTLGD
jgi:predicted dehydrogenase